MKTRSAGEKTLRRLTTVSVLAGLVLTGLFYLLAMQHIHTQAALALRERIFDNETEAGETLPALSEVYTGDRGLIEQVYAVEAAMIDDYEARKASIPYNSINRFRYQNEEVYYMPLSPATAGEKVSAGAGTLLRYADISFPAALIRRTTFLLLLVLAALSGLLVFVERKSAAALARKDSGMKNFFANASHELKTPLMAIRGYADGMERGIVTVPEGCAVIGRETDRMSALVGQILEASKLDSGAVRLHMEENDVREILYDALRVIEPAAKERGIELLPELPEPLPLVCDEELLFSAFSNILTNCVRYAGSKIELHAQRKPAGGLSVDIRNDGETLSDEDAAHIFDRFYKGSGGQTGIGLAISREYIALHRGTLCVSTEDGCTVFTAVLLQTEK